MKDVKAQHNALRARMSAAVVSFECVELEKRMEDISENMKRLIEQREQCFGRLYDAMERVDENGRS